MCIYIGIFQVLFCILFATCFTFYLSNNKLEYHLVKVTVEIKSTRSRASNSGYNSGYNSDCNSGSSERRKSEDSRSSDLNLVYGVLDNWKSGRNSVIQQTW